jgi:3-oxoacyl-[acyl-carrier-protein] synthase II
MLSSGLRPTLFLAQLSNLLAGNISIVHGVTGSSRTFMGEEQAGAEAVRIAALRLSEGRGGSALVGGAYVAGRWDMLLCFAGGEGTLWRGPGWAPVMDRQARGGGMVLGSGGAFLVLETAAHARARGAAGIARLLAIAGTAGRRRGGDTALAAAKGLAAPLLPRLVPGYAVVSGATGVAGPTGAEQEFLAWLRDGGPAQGPVTATGDLIGHLVEAAFPANLALAALLVRAGHAPQALVTGFGMWRGESLALVEPIPAETTPA